MLFNSGGGSGGEGGGYVGWEGRRGKLVSVVQAFCDWHWLCDLQLQA